MPDIPLDSRVEQIMPVAIKVEAGGEKRDKGADEEFWWSPRQCRESQRLSNRRWITRKDMYVDERIMFC
jgi:hypothetical protein